MLPYYQTVLLLLRWLVRAVKRVLSDDGRWHEAMGWKIVKLVSICNLSDWQNNLRTQTSDLHAGSA